MGFADSLTTRLFLTRRKSDIEFQIQAILSRKLAVLDRSNAVSAQLAQLVFQTGQTSIISPTNALPGVTGQPTSDIGTGIYEEELGELQILEKELDIRQKKMETELEAVKAEEESMKKWANEHAKKDFKVG